MTASEFAFMALGLVLGGASGAALVFVIGSRTPAPREIRLTVGQDAVPRRVPATLSTDGFATATAEPARGGPADRRAVDRPGRPDRTEPETVALAGPDTRSSADERLDSSTMTIAANDRGAAPPVPVTTPAVLVTSNRVGIPIHREADPAMAAIRASSPVAASIGGDRDLSQPALVVRSQDPVGGAALGGAAFSVAPLTAAAIHDRERRVDPEPMTGRASAPGGRPTGESDRSRDAGRSSDVGPVGRSSNIGPVGSADSAEAPARSASDRDEPCAAAEAIADERCRQADVARLGAERAAEAAAAAQGEYDALRKQAERARSTSDPRALQELKETARLTFRSDRRVALDRAGIDKAARTWLTTINQLNRTARDASSALARADAAALVLVPTLERLAAETDAARVASDLAAVACREATATLAACREAAAGDRRAAETMDRLAGAVGAGTMVAPNPVAPVEEPVLLEVDSRTPIIVRIVQGDRDARSRVAAALLREHGDPDRPWADLLAEFSDGVRMRAIEESLVDLPHDHPFWGQFAGDESREVVRALSALGYRYDGLGGWLDDHAPTQRDLSRAVGYAGQDPMRVRHWPEESEMTDLLTDVHVAADEYLRQAGGDLSLGEVVDLLGARADALTSLWDVWDTAQPLLHAPAEEPPSG